jgi:hypothetical protein
MAGLDPAIHVFLGTAPKDVDARVKPGHDDSVPLKSPSLRGLKRARSAAGRYASAAY